MSSNFNFNRTDSRDSPFTIQNIWPYLVGLVALVGLVVLGCMIFHTKQVIGMVNGLSWKREIVIDRYSVVHHFRESSKPYDAYNVYTSEEDEKVDDYQTVTQADGSTKMVKSGFHYEPKYYYSYDVNRWTYERTVQASGNDKKPYWPEYSLNLDGQNILGAERVESKPEIYTINFMWSDSGDKTYTYAYNAPMSEWNQYRLEGNYPLKINSFNAVMNNPLTDKVSATATAQTK